MTADEFNTRLIDMNACPVAIEWCSGQTAEHAWATCVRGDWMFWLVGHLLRDTKPYDPLRAPLIRCAAACVRLHLADKLANLPTGESLLQLFMVAEAWAADPDSVSRKEIIVAKKQINTLHKHMNNTLHNYSRQSEAIAIIRQLFNSISSINAWLELGAPVVYDRIDSAYADIVRTHYPVCPLLVENE